MSAEHGHSHHKREQRSFAYVLLPLIALSAAGGGWLWRSRSEAGTGAAQSSAVRSVLHLDTFVLNLSDRDDRAYLQVWADTLANIVADLSGTSTTCEVLQELTTEKPGVENNLFIHGTISGPAMGTFWFRVPPSTVEQLVKNKKAISENELQDKTEALRSIFASAADRLSNTVGLNHALQEVSGKNPPDLESQPSYWFRLNSAPACLLELRMDSGCAAALQARATTNAAIPPDISTNPGAEGSPQEKLEVLKHVELAVSMRFGGRRMLLKDILDLSAGSVVELDQQIQQPVDLLLDGRLIARGEVVVVDGNYGLRVTEVVADASH